MQQHSSSSSSTFHFLAAGSSITAVRKRGPCTSLPQNCRFAATEDRSNAHRAYCGGAGGCSRPFFFTPCDKFAPRACICFRSLHRAPQDIYSIPNARCGSSVLRLSQSPQQGLPARSPEEAAWPLPRVSLTSSTSPNL